MKEPFLDMAEIHRRRKWLQSENRQWPEQPMLVPVDQWPNYYRVRNVIAVWRSREFVVQVLMVSAGLVRLTICRTEIDDEGNWKSNISWDELQALKNACGFADRDAVEIYPAAKDVVNVANMRHLWVMDEPISFKWKKETNNGNQTDSHEDKRRF